jgi:hypothetical protein
MDNHDFLLPLNCIDTGFLALICINETPYFHWIVRIDGEIDGVSLNRALVTVLRAHPNLSARMCTRYMRPFRRIEHPTESTMLTYLDFSTLSSKGLTDSDIDLRFQETLTEWLNGPFDPFREFPIRVLFVRKSSSESHLVFSFDHSALDGVRSLRFMEEVVKIFDGSEHPDVSHLGDLRRSKGDELLGFARRQRAIGKNFYRKVFTSLFHRFFIAPLNPPSRVFHDKSQRGRPPTS